LIYKLCGHYLYFIFDWGISEMKRPYLYLCCFNLLIISVLIVWHSAWFVGPNMYLDHVVPKSNGKVYFIHWEKLLGNRLRSTTRQENLYSIVLNSGRIQNVNIYRRDHSFPSWSFIALLSNQSFSFKESESIRYGNTIRISTD